MARVKVNTKRNESPQLKTNRFGNLDVGTMFLAQGQVYVKTDYARHPLNQRYNAFSLDGNKSEHIMGTAMVEPVESATLDVVLQAC